MKEDMGIYVTARKIRDVLCFLGSFSALVMRFAMPSVYNAAMLVHVVVEHSSIIHIRASEVKHFMLYLLYHKITKVLLATSL